MTDQPVLIGNTTQVQQDVKAPEVPFDYQKEFEVFDSLWRESEVERQACAFRRELRRHKKNVAELRAQKILMADETIIPDRTIEQNIANKKPPFIAFIEQPQTTISFIDSANPAADFSPEAKWVTDILRYQSWKSPWLLNLDAMLLHGASFMEVVFDDSSTGKFSIEYIRRDCMVMPKNTRCIQHCTRLARMYEITKAQLQTFVAKYGFDAGVVKKITDFYKDKTEFIRVFKYFLKNDAGQVFVSWVCMAEVSVQTWLKPPEPYYIGEFALQPTPIPGIPPTITPIQTSIIPIFDFPATYEEDETILQVQGQAALSIHIQEALTGLYSATVNGAIRAAGLYATEVPTPGNERPSDKELIPLKSGYILSGNLTFATLPWPNNIALQIAQALSVRNAQQSGQTDFAAMSRQDTAKRATEIVAAKEESDKLQSTTISLWSEKSLAVFETVWSIIKNQIKIGALIPPQGLRIQELFSPTITVVMSADAQVVEKETRKNQLLQFWPIAAVTKYADPFLDTMVAEIFPEDAPVWLAKIQQQSVPLNLLSQAAGLIQATPPSVFPENLREDYGLLVNDIAAVLNPGGPGNAGPAVAGPTSNPGTAGVSQPPA